MRTTFLFSILLGLLFFSCTQNAENKVVQAPTPTQSKMVLTQYYSAKVENGIPVSDTLMNCFHCNQVIVFNGKGQEIENRFYQADLKNKYGYEIFKHNKEGHKIGSDYFEKDSLVMEYRYELNADNTIKFSKAFNPKTGEMLYGDQRFYDEKGNCIADGNMNGKGEIVQYYRRVFNENGVPVNENIEDLDGNATFSVRYEYRPQADSNWVEQITYYDDKLSEIRVRKEMMITE